MESASNQTTEQSPLFNDVKNVETPDILSAEQEKKNYPTSPDEEGFFFREEMDEAMGIKTKEYENGNRIMRCTLSTGAVAVCRELKGKDSPLARKIANNKEDLYEAALVAIATKIDDNEWVMEDLLNKMKMKDYNKLNYMSNNLNF